MAAKSTDPEVRDLQLKREAQYEELKGLYTAVRGVLFTDDQADLIKCIDLVERLTISNDKLSLIIKELKEVCESRGIDDSAKELDFSVFRQEIAKLKAEGSEWIASVKQLKSRSDNSDEENLQGSTIPRSDPPTPVTGAGNLTVGEILQIQQNTIEHQRGQMEQLQGFIATLQHEVKDVQGIRSEMSHLKDTIHTQQVDFEQRRLDFETTIRGLRDEHARDRSETRLDMDRRSMEYMSSTRQSFGFPNEGRSMSVDDVQAISSIVQKSGADMMKQMLNESIVQQERFCNSIRAPKVEIKMFNGEITEFQPFMNRFDDLIGDTNVSYSVKLNTLLQYCGPTVMKHLGCCNYQKSQDGYTMAREILVKLYGRPHVVVQAWMDRVMSTPNVKSAESIQSFSSDLKSCKKTLEHLNCLGELDNTDKKVILLSKLPTYIQNRWRKKHREACESGSIASLEDFIHVVDQAAEEQMDPIYGPDRVNQVTNIYQPGKAKNVSAPKSKRMYITTGDETVEVEQEVHVQSVKQQENKKKSQGTGDKPFNGEPCACCGKQHFTRLCSLFKEMNSAQKLEFVRTKELCLLCLSSKHTVEDCRFTWRCQITPCQGKHNNVLHWGIVGEDKRLAGEMKRSMCVSREEDPNAEVELHDHGKPMMHLKMDHFDGPIHSCMGCVDDYAMPIAPIYAKAEDKSVPTNALLDTGGGFSIITKRLREKVGLETIKQVKFRVVTLGGTQDIEADVVTVLLRGKRQPRFHVMFNAVVLDKEIVSQRFVTILGKINSWEYLKALNLPEHDVTDVDILIGQDNAHLMKQEKIVEGYYGYSPYATKSLLGWTVHGMNMNSQSSLFMHYAPTPDEMNEKMLTAIDRMQALEEVPNADVMSPVNRAIVNDWDKRVCLQDGHVVVPIPFKDTHPSMPNNYAGVEKRHLALGRRLLRNPDLLKMFAVAEKENMDAGYTEVVKEPAIVGREWYIPIQTVVSENKPGKCRIVGDGAYVYQGACINDAVHQGPNMTTNLVDVTIKFRRYPVAITGDVKAMYNQVKVPSDQRDFLRVLSWEDSDPNKEVVVLRMTTQMFGGTWSPAASIYAFRWIAHHLEDEYAQEVIDIILKHFYVDDMLTSVLDEEAGKKAIVGVRHLLGRASFLLTKVGSNSLEVLKQVPVEYRAKGFEEVDLELSEGLSENTLGSVWRPKEDVMGYKTVTSDKPATRRGVLSVMSSLYDPLGLVSPFVLLARILLQEICKLGYDWDEPLSEELVRRWQVWIGSLSIIQTFTVPRWIGMDGDARSEYQIHTFCDASQSGYGVVCYLCVYDGEREIKKISLITAKSKVAPIKVVTIPRLELTAAVLGIKVERYVREYLEVPMMQSVFWTDSMIVLYYIAGDAWQFKTFVSNRVAYIHENSSVVQWRHVPGKLNVADHASRGLMANELLDMKVWREGPQFLRNVADWPERKLGEMKSEDGPDLEYRKRYQMHFERTEDVKLSQVMVAFLERFSRWDSLIRAVASWQRVIKFMKKEKVNLKVPLTADELDRAEFTVVRLAQRHYLTDAQVNSRMFKKLFVFKQDDVIRVGGRLLNSALTYEQQHPPVLPQGHVLKLYVQRMHERIGHGGVHRTYYESRKKYWILGGKPMVKAVLSPCVICKKIRGQVKQQIMAPLPSFRVTEGQVPFQNVGVDFFGPFFVKIGRALHKRYCCVFTDLLIRAGHIEVVPDLTSAAFIDALQRFIARRGTPAMIASDNGTNFVGAKRELTEAVKEWNIENVGKFMSREGIEWKFNTPLASHHGGAWERLIRVFRSLMMAVVRDQTLTEYGLITYACIIEQIMNSRPLTKMTEDPQDPLPLSPEHLINLRRADVIPGDYSKGSVIRSRWKQLQHLGDVFWRRWSTEYLRTLQTRPKWNEEKEDLKVGDLVLLLQENTPRLQWPLGLVTQVVIGRDGHVRSVRVRTERGEYVRPITKIVSLECEK